MDISNTLSPRTENILSILFLISVSLLTNAMSLWQDMFWINRDMSEHYQWALQFQQALFEGNFIPRWASRSHFGAGDPSFLYYQPGFYYSITPFIVFGFSAWEAMKISLFLSNLTLGIIVWSTLRKRLTNTTSIIVAGMIQCHPIYIFILYFLTAFPWAFSLPLTYLFLFFSCSQTDDKINIRLSLFIALLALSHILSAFMCLLTVGTAKLILAILQKKTKPLIYWCISVALGLGLAGYYLAPALLTQNFIHPDAWYKPDILDWKNAFVFPIITAMNYGIRWLSVQWLHPLITLAPLVSILFLVRCKKLTLEKDPWSYLMATLTIMASLLFASEISFLFWNNAPLLSNVQFPFRFLTVTYLCIAVLFYSWLGNHDRSLRIPAPTTHLIISMPLLLSLLLFSQIWGSGGIAIEYLQKKSKDEIGQREYYPSTSMPGYKNYFEKGGLEKECQNRGISCKEVNHESHFYSWTIISPFESRLILPVFNFPSWLVTIDGIKAQRMNAADSGLIEISIPKGNHHIEILWKPLPIETLGKIISVLSICICFLVILYRLNYPISQE